MPSLWIRNGSIVGSGGMEEMDVLVENGIITKINVRRSSEHVLRATDSTEFMDAAGKLLFPGLIDCHVHFREPGLTHKGDMQSESRAALAGGVTTVCEMPNTVPPTVTVAALADKVRRAHAIKDCDLRFFFGVTEPPHLLALRNIWLGGNTELRRLKKHCAGVKIYLDHSTGDQKIQESILGELFAMCGQLKIPIVAHCEDAEMNKLLWDKNVLVPQKFSPIALHSTVRPPESEVKAIGFAIDLARKHGAHLHIAHLSTKGGLDLVRQAKRDQLSVTCEVAPHHLFLTIENYAELGALAKMNPPLRTMEHRDALWKGIRDGTVDCIAMDHAPHTLEEKHMGDPLKAPSGVPGVETMLPLLLTVAAGKWPHPQGRNQKPAVRGPEGPSGPGRESRIQYQDIVRLCFDNPNRIFRLGKQGIREGVPADIVIIDPQRERMIHGKDLHAKCGWTPYEGWSVTGSVEKIVS